jgi:hypothetical protein
MHLGILGSGPKPFFGLNAKARLVAGLNLYSISYLYLGESSFWLWKRL